jgi:hypothetical protein
LDLFNGSGGERLMWQEVKRNFILQHGFEEPAPAVCPRQYSALHFQPRTVFVWIVAGILFHSPPVFYLLCAVLWWSALLPKLNPFDALYNLILGGNRLTAFYLTPAPAPRRTAQAFSRHWGLLPLLWLLRLRAYSQFRKFSTTSVNQDPAQAFSLSLPYRTLFSRSSLLP